MDPLAMLLAFLPVLDFAAEKAKEPLAPRIDAAIRKQAENFDRDAAGRSDDLVFLRRVSLDLTGTIPSVERTRAYLAYKAADKRVRLVDELLVSDAYARHMATVFDVLLMDRRAGEQ